MNPTQILIIVGLLLILAELFAGFSTGFDLVLIGTTLLVGGAIGLFFENEPLAIVAASVLCFLYIALGRTRIKKQLIVLTHKTNIDKLLGKTGIVVRSITPSTAGLVRLDDEDWRATSDDLLYEKDKIEVVSIEGVTLRVKKLPKDK